MNSYRRVASWLAAIVLLAAGAVSHAADRTSGGRWPRDLDRNDSNHYILCVRCTDGADVPIGRPNGITTDWAGNVYFSSENIVYELTHKGTLLRVAGNGAPGFAGDGGPAVDALLNIPLDDFPEIRTDPFDYYPLVGGLAVDPAGNLYIADAYNGRIRKVDADGTITTFLDGLLGVQGLAADPAGNLYVSGGSVAVALTKIAPDGARKLLTGNDCGSFEKPGVCVPEQIALDSAGNVYVPDGYCRVRKVAPDGSVVTVAGDSSPSGGFVFTCGYSPDGVPAAGAALSNMPYAVAVDGSGNLLVADTYNHCIRVIDNAGVISTFAGRCQAPGYSGDGGLATDATLDTPMGVAVDAAGNVYIADTENRRVRKVGLDRIITTVAGNGEP